MNRSGSGNPVPKQFIMSLSFDQSHARMKTWRNTSTFVSRSKIRPKNVFSCYVPFLGLIFWMTICSNCNTLTFDSRVYLWNNLSVILIRESPLPLVDALTKMCPKYWKSTFVSVLFTKIVSKTHMLNTMTSQFYEWLRISMKKACSDHWLFWPDVYWCKICWIGTGSMFQLYHSIIYTEQGTSDINFDLWEAIWMGPEHFWELCCRIILVCISL